MPFDRRNTWQPKPENLQLILTLLEALLYSVLFTIRSNNKISPRRAFMCYEDVWRSEWVDDVHDSVRSFVILCCVVVSPHFLSHIPKSWSTLACTLVYLYLYVLQTESSVWD